ncbi:hypothetical protein L7F22_031745 [Adiantum nelumboides]|nr:hypothetical protein [Adiantum nelumboides]
MLRGELCHLARSDWQSPKRTVRLIELIKTKSNCFFTEGIVNDLWCRVDLDEQGEYGSVLQGRLVLAPPPTEGDVPQQPAGSWYRLLCIKYEEEGHAQELWRVRTSRATSTSTVIQEENTDEPEQEEDTQDQEGTEQEAVSTIEVGGIKVTTATIGGTPERQTQKKRKADRSREEELEKIRELIGYSGEKSQEKTTTNRRGPNDGCVHKAIKASQFVAGSGELRTKHQQDVQEGQEGQEELPPLPIN